MEYTLYNAVLIYFRENVEAATPADIASQSFAPISSIWHFLHINEKLYNFMSARTASEQTYLGMSEKFSSRQEKMSSVKYYSSVDKHKPLYYRNSNL
jgi:hypothetical protein